MEGKIIAAEVKYISEKSTDFLELFISDLIT